MVRISLKPQKLFSSFGLIILLFFLIACGDSSDELVKPLGDVRLEYPLPTYKEFETDCPFQFEYSNYAKSITKEEKPCWYIINYPKMKASIYLTYYPISDKKDLAVKIKDSERLAQEQTVKASYIAPQEFSFDTKRVYGTLFELGGESAINLQFHVTDSTSNLISGSVYFNTVPKPDSLAPAIDYIKKDVRHLIETLEWK